MKMAFKNPGGEVMTRPTMKGVEKFMKKGKGNLTSYTPSGLTKGNLASPGLGKFYCKDHTPASMSGATVSTTHKAAR